MRIVLLLFGIRLNFLMREINKNNALANVLVPATGTSAVPH